MRRRLLVCLLGGFAVASTHAGPLPEGTAACLERIAETPPGPPARLGDVCPELIGPLENSSWGEALASTGAAGEMTASAFVALTRLATGYERANGPVIATGALDAALEQVADRVPPPELSLWERLSQRLRDWLARRDEPRSGWLAQWLARHAPSDRWLRAALVTVALVVILGAAGVVANELKAWGVFGAKATRQRRRRAYAPGAAQSRRALTLGEISSAPLARQPALLLTLVLERLRERRAPLAASATHRELAAAAAEIDGVEADAFARIATAAERSVYAGWVPAPEDAAELRVSGRVLLDRLPSAGAKR